MLTLTAKVKFILDSSRSFMKTVKFVPSQCQGETPTFEGFIEMRMPTFDEKFGILEDIELKMTDGEVDVSNSQSNMKTLRKAVKLSQGFYKMVALKHIKTGEEYKSFDEMTCDEKCHPILIEVGMALLGGFKMGND